MSKHHVNRETGEVGVCTAKPGNCPVSDGEDHFDDYEEACVRSEHKLAEMYGTTTTISSARKKLQNIRVKDKEYPHPETSLKNIDRVAETLKTGPHTAKQIAAAHGVVGRVGNYQADALCYVGLATHSRHPKTGENVYALNDAGEAYTTLSEGERQEILINIVQETPLAKIYSESGENAALDYVKRTKIRTIKEDATVGDQKKIETIKAWVNQTTNGDSFLDDDYVYQKPEIQKEKLGDICPNCFTAKPLTGICENCGE